MICLSLALLSSLAVGPAEVPSSFEEKVKAILPSMGMHFAENRIVLGPEELGYYPGCREFKRMHDELPLAIASADSASRKAALAYLVALASLARGSAWELDRDEGDDALGRALGHDARSIRTSLERISKMAKGEEALLVSVALLALSPDDRRATDVVVREVRSSKVDQQRKACRLVGSMRLSQPNIIAALGATLHAEGRAVRLAAAEAAWRIGPRAGKIVPDLVSLLERGKEAWGDVTPFMVIALPRKDNLALLALAEMGDAARPAVPVIVRLLKGADEKTRLALLDCLGQLGESAKESEAAVRQYLATGSPAVRLRAAVVLLCLNPSDEKAIPTVAAALKGDDQQRRTETLAGLARFGPKVKALVPPLVAILDRDARDGDVEMATEAVGRMGPIAAAAVPALVRDLYVEGKGSRPYRAAWALAEIGKPALPALLGAVRGNGPRPKKDEKDDPDLSALEHGLCRPGVSGRMAAIRALGQFRDQRAEVMPVLMKALEDEVFQGVASYALGRLRPNDPKVKASLIRVRDRKSKVPKDAPRRESEEEFLAETQMMAAWALKQLPR